MARKKFEAEQIVVMLREAEMELFIFRRVAEYIRSDSGPEFVSKIVRN